MQFVNSTKFNFDEFINGLSPALWFDPSDTSTLFDATSGGSTPSIGAGIARIEGKGASGINPIQATVGLRPLRGTMNGRSCLEYDGTSQFLSFDSSTNLMRNITKATIYAVVDNAGATGATQAIFNLSFSNVGINFTRLAITNVGRINGGLRRVPGDSTGSVSSDDSSLLGARNVLVTEMDFSNREITHWINQVFDATKSWPNITAGSTDNTASSRFRLGASIANTPDLYFNGKIGDVIIFNGEHSEDLRRVIIRNLKLKWGVA